MGKPIGFIKVSLIILFISVKDIYCRKEYVVETDTYNDDFLVNTNAGPIRGIRPTSGDYTMYMGIPFAKVDETNPFGASKPYPKFEQPFEAYHDSAICPQIEEFNNTITGTLDCLQVNVYVPDSVNSTNPLPVLIWIYGGAYSIGFANRYLYGPAYLVRHNIIFITINYRVGPYGFMCLDTPEVPGNQGLKDQLMGLRWIKENIEFFGGDKNKITVFGQSVGAISTHLHLLSEHEDLFHQAIMHSGSAFLSETISKVNKEAPIKLAEKLGFITADMHDALAFISSADTDSVIRAASEIDFTFWPCIESVHNGQEALITEHPLNQDIPKIKNKSVLLGFTDEEMIMLYSNLPSEAFQNVNFVSDFFQTFFSFTEQQLNRIQNIVTSFYLGGTEYSRDVLPGIVNAHSDLLFIDPVERCIDSFLNNGAEKLFYFKFSYIGNRNFIRIKTNTTIGGAAHTDEIGYLFDMQYFPEEPTSEDQLMIDRITTMWTNFVKYGDPTPQTSTLLPVKWEPITQSSLRYYMNIDSELSLDTNVNHERMSFWDLFFETHFQYEVGYKDRNFASSSGYCTFLLFVHLALWHILK